MAYQSIILSDPVTGLSSTIRPRPGVAVTSLDVQPAVRAVVNSVVGGDGTRDTTRFLDAAAVTVSLRLSAPSPGVSPEAFLDEIGALCAPYARPVLVVTNDQWATPRQLAVRFDSRTAPVDNPFFTDVAISWKVPSGAWQGTAQLEYDIPASVSSLDGAHFTSAGAHFTSVGLHFRASTTSSDMLVAVPGTLKPPWKCRLYGPCTGPKLANDTTGGDIRFTDALVLGAGEYVELDSAARTANFLSDPGQPRLSLLDFAATTWWDLLPAGGGYGSGYGVAYPPPATSNLIRYHPTSGSGSGAVLTFLPAWLA
jgi:hypothetical protein